MSNDIYHNGVKIVGCVKSDKKSVTLHGFLKCAVMAKVKFEFMKINKKVLVLFSLLAVMLWSCSSDDDESAIVNTSHRDGSFVGSQLEVYLDGSKVVDATSATMKSTLLNANVNHDTGSDDVVAELNPTYNSTITIEGFPQKGKTVTLNTVTNLMGFEGTTEVDGVTYDYDAEFIGTPLLHHDNQGMIIRFTT